MRSSNDALRDPADLARCCGPLSARTLLRDRTVREPRDLIKARACIDLLKEFAVAAHEAVRLFKAACLKQRVTVRRRGLIQMRG